MGKTRNQFIARYAEQHGFTTAIEGQGSNGKAVDVALEKDGKRIAVEISVTTRAADELENITKDFAGGFTCIVSLFVSPTTRDAVKRLLDEQDEGLQSDAIYCGLVKEYAGLIRQVSRTLG